MILLRLAEQQGAPKAALRLADGKCLRAKKAKIFLARVVRTSKRIARPAMQQRAFPIGGKRLGKRRRPTLQALSRSAVGLELTMPTADGCRRRRVYLDSAATTLRLDVVQEVLNCFLPYYSNTHSTVHFGARISTEEYRWAHEMVLRFVHANPATYTAFFVGSGTTGGMNRLAQTLCRRLPGRDVVISSVMEHHSNDLPHRRHFSEVIHIPPSLVGAAMGTLDLAAIERALMAYSGRVAYVSVTGVSNVTGIVNPVHDIAALAHAHGALMIVDGAQMVAHLPVVMSGNRDPARDIDALVFSGHKIYAPGSPGVVVVRKTLFEGGVPFEVGGGMVDDVWVDRYSPTETLPDREEAGTPNIIGAIGLAAALYALDKVGMEAVHAKETSLMSHAIKCLKALDDDVIIYGDTDLTRIQRAGAISFNVRGMHHALTAAILNDYFNIAVRNQCFCAHPYVREMITEVLSAEDNGYLSNEQLEELAEMQRGMVRASFGIYTREADIDALSTALAEITADQQRFEANYERLPNGNFRHRNFHFEPRNWFSVRDGVAAWLASP